MADMTDLKEIAQVAIDAHNGVVKQYSAQDAQKLLREALVEMNGGSTKLDYRKIRDGKCAGMFTLIETILDNTVLTGLQGDEYFMSLCDYHDVAEGDAPVFEVEDATLFAVAKVADGTMGIRRQRLGGVTQVTVPTALRLVRIYDDLNRILAGRVDFNDMINRVGESFLQQMRNDIYAVWSAATAAQLGGTTYFPTAGAYDEDELLDLIAHVEAAAGGKTATIIGTAKALRKVDVTPLGDKAKEDLYNLGYAGKFYGTPVVAVPQRHKVGTTEFVLNDNVLTIVAGDEKPIKIVREGSPIAYMGDPFQNADLTQEYYYGEKYGVGLVLAGNNTGIGRYEMA